MAENASASNTPASGTTPPATLAPSATPPHVPGPATAPTDAPSSLTDALNGDYVGSPLKKPRASVSITDEDGLRKRLGSNLANNIGEVLGATSADHTAPKDTEMGAATGSGSTGSHFGGSLNRSPPAPAQPHEGEDDL